MRSGHCNFDYLNLKNLKGCKDYNILGYQKDFVSVVFVIPVHIAVGY